MAKLTKIKNEDSYYKKAEAKTDWDEGNLLKVKNFVDEQYQKNNKLKILEIGCGQANILDNINSEIEYFGVDPSDYCNEHFNRVGRVSIRKAIAENLPFKDGEFDLVFSNHALEHFFDPKKALEEMDRVVKKNGHIVLVAPNHELPWTKLNAIRHYSKNKLRKFILVRIVDFLKHLFGLQVFRLIKDNYSTIKKSYELPDDDLIYIVSSMEVSKFFKKRDYEILSANDSVASEKKGLIAIIKNTIIKIPTLKYSFNNLFFIFKKR